MKAERQKVQKANADQSMGYRVLKDPRHEAFAQARAEGLPAYKAWLQAGYKGSTQVAMSSSSRLLRNVEVQNRLRALIEQLADTMMVTKESLLAEYEQARSLAHELGQASAAIAAVAAKQRLVGLDPMTKSLNVSISGSFNQLTEDELGFELASMINEVRGAAGKPPLPLTTR